MVLVCNAQSLAATSSKSNSVIPASHSTSYNHYKKSCKEMTEWKGEESEKTGKEESEKTEREESERQEEKNRKRIIRKDRKRG